MRCVCDKDVALPAPRLQVDGFRWILLDLAPQPKDQHIHSAIHIFRQIVAKLSQQFNPWDDLIRALQEIVQKALFCIGQRDFFVSIIKQNALLLIHCEPPKRQAGRIDISRWTVVRFAIST